MSEKFALILAEEAQPGTEFTVTAMCTALGVSQCHFFRVTWV